MFTLTVYTELWTHDDVAFGANDPEKTTEETLTFDSVADVVTYLIDETLTDPSSSPVVDVNIPNLWFSEGSKFIVPGEEMEDRHPRTAHRGDDIPADVWSDIVRQVTRTGKYFGTSA